MTPPGGHHGAHRKIFWYLVSIIFLIIVENK